MAPAVDFKYMTASDDWPAMRRSLRIARELVGFMDLEGVVEVTPGAACDSDDAIDAFLRKELESAYVRPSGDLAGWS